MNKIPIAFCFNDDYTIPTGVSLFSLLTNSGENSFYEFYILYIDGRLNNENKEKIRQLEDCFSNCVFKFINVGEIHQDYYVMCNYTIDIYVRLFIPILLHYLDVIIYIDSDTIVLGDIVKEVLTSAINEKSISVVKDELASCNKNFQSYLGSIDIDKKSYFNAGFIVFNIKRINSMYDIGEITKSLLIDKFRYPDQDILNKIFSDDVCYLDAKYNYTYNHKLKDDFEKPIVIHYIGLNKPWNSPCAYGDLWWQYYRESPFYCERYYFLKMQEIYEDIEKHIKIGEFLKKKGVYRLIIWAKGLLKKMN